MSLNTWLQKYSEELTESNTISEKHNAVAEKIFKFLKTRRSDVDRYVIAGNLWSHQEDINTSKDATTPPDFDLVIFLRNQKPPYQQVLLEFGESFSNNNEEFTIVNTFHSLYIGVIFQNLKFHIFPACDLTNGQRGSTTTEAQKENVLAIIRESPYTAQVGRVCSSSLAESAVEWTNQQSDFAKSIACLAKVWIRHIYFDEEQQIHGISYLVDVMASFVAKKVGPQTDFLEAFTHFLALVANFSNVKIIHEDATNAILSDGYKGPLILDPVNPFNNLAIFRSESAEQEVIVRCIQAAGTCTLWKLEAAKIGNIRISSTEDVAALFKQKQPTVSNKIRAAQRQAQPRRPMTPMMWILVIIFGPFVAGRAMCRVLARRFKFVTMAALFVLLYLLNRRAQ